MKFTIDIHVHSWASGDSEADPEELVQQAIRNGLHGIAITEHYSYEASEPVEMLRDRYRNEILIFRGVEFSAAEGHCLIFGMNTDKFLSKDMSVKDIIAVADKHGGIVIPTHPYRGVNSLGDAIIGIKGLCAIEGHNGYNPHSFNKKAIEAATVLGLPFTGGSDAHNVDDVGLCYTEFYDKVTHDNFIDLLKAGNYQGVDTRVISKVIFPDLKIVRP